MRRGGGFHASGCSRPSCDCSRSRSCAWATRNTRATTRVLRPLHAARPACVVSGHAIRFRFRGKAGKCTPSAWPIARSGVCCGGSRICPARGFFIRAADGTIHDVESGDVNAYLREISGGDFTAKDFRTWAARCSRRWRCVRWKPSTARRRRSENIVAPSSTAASRLGNTPTICRKCYVHSEVIESYLDGSMADSSSAAPRKACANPWATAPRGGRRACVAPAEAQACREERTGMARR